MRGLKQRKAEIKRLVLAMGLLGLFSVCKAQVNTKPAMPQGKLLSLEYSFSGRRSRPYLSLFLP